MDNVSIRKIELIVNDLLSEFEKEGGKLQSEYDDNAVRIIEIDEHIHNYKESEDVDFRVFSPRKIDNQNEEKINALKLEKDNIELTNKSLFRQLRYYSDKIEKLNEILNIISESDINNPEDKESFDDIKDVDQKIMEYYDSIVDNDEPLEYIVKDSEIKSGWKIIKEQLDTPIDTVNKSEKEITEDSESVVKSLLSISEKLEAESEAIKEDYIRTKEEISNVLNSINDVLNKIKK